MPVASYNFYSFIFLHHHDLLHSQLPNILNVKCLTLSRWFFLIRLLLVVQSAFQKISSTFWSKNLRKRQLLPKPLNFLEWYAWGIAYYYPNHDVFPGRSIIVKKGDGSQVKESTDSSTTLEDDDIKGRINFVSPY